jgi:2'-5' RNA ligase
MEAHVTVLAPFRHGSALDDEALAALTRVFAPHRPFEFELTRVERFEDGTVYLAPVPAKPFVALTHAVTTRFPDHRPYGGAFATVVPHLTVGRDVDCRVPLPIRAEARSVALVQRGDDLRWHTRRSFALGPES